MKYRVAWKSTLTGHSGHGQWQENRELVEAAVKLANRMTPECDHWMETEA